MMMTCVSDYIEVVSYFEWSKIIPWGLKCEPVSWTFPYKRDLSQYQLLMYVVRLLVMSVFLNMERSLFVSE